MKYNKSPITFLALLFTMNLIHQSNSNTLESGIEKFNAKNHSILQKMNNDLAILKDYHARIIKKESDVTIQNDVSKWRYIVEKKAVVEESINRLQERKNNLLNSKSLQDGYKLDQVYEDEVAKVEQDKELMDLLGSKIDRKKVTTTVVTTTVVKKEEEKEEKKVVDKLDTKHKEFEQIAGIVVDEKEAEQARTYLVNKEIKEREKEIEAAREKELQTIEKEKRKRAEEEGKRKEELEKERIERQKRIEEEKKEREFNEKLKRASEESNKKKTDEESNKEKIDEESNKKIDKSEKTVIVIKNNKVVQGEENLKEEVHPADKIAEFEQITSLPLDGTDADSKLVTKRKKVIVNNQVKTVTTTEIVTTSKAKKFDLDVKETAGEKNTIDEFAALAALPTTKKDVDKANEQIIPTNIEVKTTKTTVVKEKKVRPLTRIQKENLLVRKSILALEEEKKLVQQELRLYYKERKIADKFYSRQKKRIRRVYEKEEEIIKAKLPDPEFEPEVLKNYTNEKDTSVKGMNISEGNKTTVIKYEVKLSKFDKFKLRREHEINKKLARIDAEEQKETKEVKRNIERLENKLMKIDRDIEALPLFIAEEQRDRVVRIKREKKERLRRIKLKKLRDKREAEFITYYLEKHQKDSLLKQEQLILADLEREKKKTQKNLAQRRKEIEEKFREREIRLQNIIKSEQTKITTLKKEKKSVKNEIKVVKKLEKELEQIRLDKDGELSKIIKLENELKRRNKELNRIEDMEEELRRKDKALKQEKEQLKYILRKKDFELTVAKKNLGLPDGNIYGEVGKDEADLYNVFELEDDEDVRKAINGKKRRLSTVGTAIKNFIKDNRRKLKKEDRRFLRKLSLLDGIERKLDIQLEPVNDLNKEVVEISTNFNVDLSRFSFLGDLLKNVRKRLDMFVKSRGKEEVGQPIAIKEVPAPVEQKEEERKPVIILERMSEVDGRPVVILERISGPDNEDQEDQEPINIFEEKNTQLNGLEEIKDDKEFKEKVNEVVEKSNQSGNQGVVEQSFETSRVVIQNGNEKPQEQYKIVIKKKNEDNPNETEVTQVTNVGEDKGMVIQTIQTDKEDNAEEKEDEETVTDSLTETSPLKEIQKEVTVVNSLSNTSPFKESQKEEEKTVTDSLTETSPLKEIQNKDEETVVDSLTETSPLKENETESFVLTKEVNNIDNPKLQTGRLLSSTNNVYLHVNNEIRQRLNEAISNLEECYADVDIKENIDSVLALLEKWLKHQKDENLISLTYILTRLRNLVNSGKTLTTKKVRPYLDQARQIIIEILPEIVNSSNINELHYLLYSVDNSLDKIRLKIGSMGLQGLIPEELDSLNNTVEQLVARLKNSSFFYNLFEFEDFQALKERLNKRLKKDIRHVNTRKIKSLLTSVNINLDALFKEFIGSNYENVDVRSAVIKVIDRQIRKVDEWRDKWSSSGMVFNSKDLKEFAEEIKKELKKEQIEVLNNRMKDTYLILKNLNSDISEVKITKVDKNKILTTFYEEVIRLYEMIKKKMVEDENRGPEAGFEIIAEGGEHAYIGYFGELQEKLNFYLDSLKRVVKNDKLADFINKLLDKKNGKPADKLLRRLDFIRKTKERGGEVELARHMTEVWKREGRKAAERELQAVFTLFTEDKDKKKKLIIVPNSTSF